MVGSEIETQILGRVICPDSGNLPPQVAKELLNWRFDESDAARMTELSMKAQDGALSEAEREELEGFINVSHFIALMQSKARISTLTRAPI
ncbi:MAG TPA: hypothetical protein VH370_06925 [Humisphaera sp.]|jgi:hypothetical protein|nr:hypothetical protein [Humisphaera sp.]